MRISLPLSPIVVMESRLAFFVRSGLIASHESPRSRERKTRLAAARSTPPSLGDCRSGVSQWKRNCSPRAAFTVLNCVGRMLRTSPVTMLRLTILPSCDSV